MTVLRAGFISPVMGPWAQHPHLVRPSIIDLDTDQQGIASFPELEQKHGQEIKTPDQLGHFLHALSRSERSNVLSDINRIKAYFADHTVAMAGDCYPIKLSNKEYPLTFHFEGAEILPVDVAIARSLDAATTNIRYAMAVWGGNLRGDKDKDAIKKQFESSQASGWSSALAFATGSKVEGSAIPNQQSAVLPAVASAFRDRFLKNAKAI